MVSDLISNEEKRQALERVIASRTFSRSDQLRAFLRYICEAEFEGRAQELNEYVLGVSVLGRPPDYSPTEDSCVRSRAYELRSKLKSYYRLEAQDDPIQIEIRKGAYVPQFQRTAEAAPSENTVALVTAPAVTPAAPTIATPSPASAPPKRRLLRPSVALILIAVLAAPVLYYLYSIREKTAAGGFDPQGWTPEMGAFWKPFLGSATPLIVSFEIRLFFFSPSTGLVVRDYQTNQLADLAGSKPLAGFRARMGAGELQETSDYTDFGAVHAAFLLGRVLGPQHKEMGLKHSESLGWEDLWNSNVIFIGKPNLNPTIRYALKSADFTEDELGLVKNLHPLPGEPAEYRSATTHGSGVKYAVITLLPGPQSGHHVMILGGAGAEFLWALAECVTDPAHVKELVSHLRLPSGELPGAFQVVVQATFESNVPIKVRYITHRVSKTS
jgi:hypothetical protein